MKRCLLLMMVVVLWHRPAVATPTQEHADIVVPADGSGSDVDEAAPTVKHRKKKKKKRAKKEAEPETRPDLDEPPAEAPPAEAPPAEPPPSEAPGEEAPKVEDKGGLDFDLNVTPKAEDHVTLTAPVDTQAIRVRRTMLILHQAVGIALTVTTLGSVITGQLSYSDKFGGPNSGRYELAHQLFVWPTEGLAAVTAGLAIFAPVPIEKGTSGFDRMTLHKIGEFSAFAGWATELVLGVYTASREGYANQQTFATAHMAIGYFTLAGMLLGVGAIVF